MKTTNRLFILMAIVLFLLSSNSYAQETHTLTLYVDTDSINEDNKETTCYIERKDVSIKDYTTQVNLEDKIIWVGGSLNGNDKVKIKKIRYVSGAEILKNNKLINCLFSQKVRGKVNKKDKFDLTKGNVETYSIEFKVKRRGRSNENFIVDPKLQIGG